MLKKGNFLISCEWQYQNPATAAEKIGLDKKPAAAHQRPV